MTAIQSPRARWGLFIAAALTASAAHGQAARKAVFVAHDSNNEGSVASFVFDASDHPVLVQRLVTPARNATSISISPNGRYLVTTHASAAANEDLTIIEIASDATLRLVAAFTVLIASTALDVTWISDEYIVVPRAPSGPGDYALEVYRFDPAPPAGPSLTLVDSIPGSPPFSGLTVIDRHRTLPIVYVGDSPLGGTMQLLAYAVDQAGQLSLVDQEFLGPYIVGLAVSHDARRLYAPQGIGGSGRQIEAFDLRPDGTMTYNTAGPFQSFDNSPKGAAFGQDDGVLFVVHGGDGRALSYPLDPATGSLGPARLVYDARIGFALGTVATLGDIVLVTDESTIFDNQRGLLAFRYTSTGQVSPLGSIVDTGSSGAEEIAVWMPESACYADCDGSGALDIFDFLCFQNSFVAGEPYACECDSIPTCDIFDFLCFQNAFVAGCP